MRVCVCVCVCVISLIFLKFSKRKYKNSDISWRSFHSQKDIICDYWLAHTADLELTH